ncbi:MAG: SusD/RagB family nutrient-binding outer membrane lipoprotein [Ferruginibacter sp.]|nr:SusD/RagB family nutrient-binding outer membrane lipoprotein [Cytophagales bacterium]
MKKLGILICSLILLASCAKDLEEYNVDQKRATAVPAATLFTGATVNLADALTTPNVNSNVFRFYVQYWTATTYLEEPRYNLTSRTIPLALWQSLYRDVLSDLQEAKRLIQADPLLPQNEKNNQFAQIGITEVYAWSVLVNTYGNIPYTEALNIENTQPKYDDAATVYADLLTRLDAALGLLDPSAEGFASADLLYQGDIGHWVKFGNSLKLKLGMVLADANPAAAAAAVQAAAPNVFTGNADNAAFPYVSAPPNNNPIADNLNPALTSRKDFLSSVTLVDKMNSLSDPRRPAFFSPLNGEFVGGAYGFLNPYANFSPINPRIYTLDFEGLLLDYSEVAFFLAEAVERGFLPGSAAEHYNDAITASIDYWGGSPADATAYLANPGVAYATAEGNYRQKIGTQKWIALYNRGYDAWIEWRRLDFPVLLPPSGGNAPSGLVIPTRLIYPTTEPSLNVNYQAGAEAIGGDKATTKLFWDRF